MTLFEIPWTVQAAIPPLGVLQLLPLIATAIFLTQPEVRWSTALGVGIAAAELAVAIFLYCSLDRNIAAMQFAEWSKSVAPLAYHAAADGITVLFALLSALLTLLVAIYAAFRSSSSRFLALVFATEATTMAMLATANLLWFASLVAVEIGILGYFVWTWNGAGRMETALVRSLAYLTAAPMLLLVGTLILGWESARSTGRWSFDLFDLALVAISPEIQSISFVPLFLGMALLTPLFPFHIWLRPLTTVGDAAPLLALFVCLKLGIYGMLRFLFPLLPDAILFWDGTVAAIATGGTGYAAIQAIRKTDPRRLLSYAVVTHTNILVLGLFSLQTPGLRGSVALTPVLGIALAILLLAAGSVPHRSADGPRPKSARARLYFSVLGGSAALAILATTGLPGVPGFVAAENIFEAVEYRFGLAALIVAVLGNLITSGRLLWALSPSFLYPSSGDGPESQSNASPSLTWLLPGVTAIALLWVGYGTHFWLSIVDRPLMELGRSFSGG